MFMFRIDNRLTEQKYAERASISVVLAQYYYNRPAETYASEFDAETMPLYWIESIADMLPYGRGSYAEDIDAPTNMYITHDDITTSYGVILMRAGDDIDRDSYDMFLSAAQLRRL